jgi:hypothetical protein
VSIQPDFVSWCECRGRLTSAVIVHGVLIFRLCKCRLCFLNSKCHAIREFIDRLQVRARLLWFKAHARVSSGVDHEGGLLSRRVYTVIVVKLA